MTRFWFRKDLLRKLKDNLPGSVDYPDVLLDDSTALEYDLLCKSLSKSRYLFAKDDIISPASIWQFFFQKIRGFFGYRNHCDTQWVNYRLQKLALYGALQNYPPFTFTHTRYHLDDIFKQPLPNRFLQFELWNNKIAQMQSKLINSFIPLSSLSTGNPLSVIFGWTMYRANLLTEIPRLHPQDANLIRKLVTAIVADEKPFNDKIPIPGLLSKQLGKCYFAEAFQQLDLVNTAAKPADNLSLSFQYLNKARSYLPNIEDAVLECFVKIYIEHEQCGKAFSIIQTFKDRHTALTWLMKFPPNERNLHIKNTPFEHELMQMETNQVALDTIVDRLPGDNPQLTKELLFLRNSSPEATFRHFQSHSGIFKPREKTKMAHICIGRANHEATRAQKYADAHDWKNSQKHFEESLVEANKAKDLDPSCCDRYIQILLNFIKMQLSKARNKMPHEYDVEALEKILENLKRCQTSNVDLIKETSIMHGEILLKIAMHRIQTNLATYPDFDEIRVKDYVLEKQEVFTRVTQYLQKIIETVTPYNSNQQARILLAKAHFILGDMNLFFDIGDYHTNLSLAATYDPTNPFFVLNATAFNPDRSAQLVESATKKIKGIHYDYSRMNMIRWENHGEVVPILAMCEYTDLIDALRAGPSTPILW